MSLLMPELERQLRAAARARGAEHDRRPRRRIPGLGPILITLSLAAVAAVALPAILLLGHRGPSTTAAARGAIPQPIPGQRTAFETCTGRLSLLRTSRAPSVLSKASRAGYVVEAQGSLAGHAWSLFARSGENGFQAVEDGRFGLDGRAYGMCPGAPNPAEFSLIDAGAHGIVYGYIADPGSYTISLHLGPNASTPLLREVLGGTFFIQVLPKPACSYPSLTLTARTSGATFEHTYSFGRCAPGQQVVLTGGHGSRGGKRLPPPRLNDGLPAHGIPTLSQLLANFAILGHPATPADRSWGPPPSGRYARLLPRLTRLARTLPDGTRVFLTVQRYTGPGWPSVYPVGSYELDLNIVPANGNDVDSTNYGPNVNYTVFPLTSAPPGAVRRGRGWSGAPTWASIIPNGVSRVRWTFACPLARCAQREVTVIVPVHENVAAALIPGTEPELGSPHTLRRIWQPVMVTWYGPGGRVLASYGQSGGNLSAPPFIKTH